VTDLEAFRQRYLRAKLLRSHRAKMAGARRIAAESNSRFRRQRALLVLDAVEHGTDRVDAALLCGCTEDALRRWLFTYAGSTLWPPSAEGVAKLRDVAQK
jgi:hypothetical protein